MVRARIFQSPSINESEVPLFFLFKAFPPVQFTRIKMTEPEEGQPTQQTEEAVDANFTKDEFKFLVSAMGGTLHPPKLIKDLVQGVFKEDNPNSPSLLSIENQKWRQELEKLLNIKASHQGGELNKTSSKKNDKCGGREWKVYFSCRGCTKKILVAHFFHTADDLSKCRIWFDVLAGANKRCSPPKRTSDSDKISRKRTIPQRKVNSAIKRLEKAFAEYEDQQEKLFDRFLKGTQMRTDALKRKQADILANLQVSEDENDEGEDEDVEDDEGEKDEEQDDDQDDDEVEVEDKVEFEDEVEVTDEDEDEIGAEDNANSFQMHFVRFH